MSDIGTYIKAENLPTDLLGRLEAVTINSGANFIAGKATSAFADLRETAGNVTTAINTLSPSNLISIGKELTEHAITITTNELSSYISEITTDLLNFDGIVSRLTESIAYWTKVNTKSTQEILDSLKTTNVKNTSDDNLKKLKEEGIAQVKEKVSEGLNNITTFYNENIKSLENGLNTITAYITNGPDWVITTTNSYVEQVINKVEGFISQQSNSIISFRDSTIDSIGRRIGTAAAAPINSLALSVAKKAKANSEKLISQAQTKALNGLTKAMMVVRQLTGIAVPTVFPKLPKLTSLLG